MLRVEPSPALEADHIANETCRRRLMNAALTMAVAWLTYVDPIHLQVREGATSAWLAAVVGISAAAIGYGFWAVTDGDRRAWLRAFEETTRNQRDRNPSTEESRAGL